MRINKLVTRVLFFIPDTSSKDLSRTSKFMRENFMKQRGSQFPSQWGLNPTIRSAAVAMIFVVFIFLNIATCQAQQAHPDVVLHRTVTYPDRQTYIELPFDVPEGVSLV